MSQSGSVDSSATRKRTASGSQNTNQSASSGSQKPKEKRKVRIGGATLLGGFDNSDEDDHDSSMKGSRKRAHHGSHDSEKILQPSELDMTGTAWAKDPGSLFDDENDDEDEDLELFGRRRRNDKSDAYVSDEDVADSDDDDDGDQTKPNADGLGRTKQFDAIRDAHADGSQDDNKESDDDDDMFKETAAPKSKNGSNGNPKDKSSRHLRREDIEGQEWGGHDDDDDDKEGIKIEPFNMDKEMDEGSFDENGHYIRKKDEFAVHDSWLDGINKTEIEKARRAHEVQMNRERAAAERAQSAQDAASVHQLWFQALGFMRPGETLLTAIRRLAGTSGSAGGGAASKSIPSWKRKRMQADKSESKTESKSAADAPKQSKEMSDVERLTALGSELFDRDLQTYDLRYEQVVRMLRMKEMLPDSWMPGDPLPGSSTESQKSAKDASAVSNSAAAETLFEFKWGAAATDVYGPYPLSQMQAWQTAGYLAQGDAHVRVAGSDSDFKPFSKMQFN